MTAPEHKIRAKRERGKTKVENKNEPLKAELTKEIIIGNHEERKRKRRTREKGKQCEKKQKNC